MNKGARFTAINGQELCQRIQKLEGILDQEEMPCNYLKQPTK